MAEMFGGFFGGSAGSFFTAIMVVSLALAALVVVFWIVKRLSGARTGKEGGKRTGGPRLAVLDTIPVDDRRRLLLVRRDDVEHLLMIGGPGDIVVESRIMPQRAETATPATHADRAVAVPVAADAGSADRAARPAARPAATTTEDDRHPADILHDARKRVLAPQPGAHMAPTTQFPAERFQSVPQQERSGENASPTSSPTGEAKPHTGGIAAANPFSEDDFGAFLDAEIARDQKGPSQTAADRGEPAGGHQTPAPQQQVSQETRAKTGQAESTIDDEMGKLLRDMTSNWR